MISSEPTGAGSTRPARTRKRTPKAAEAAQQEAAQQAPRSTKYEGAQEHEPETAEPAAAVQSASSDNGASTSAGTKRARKSSLKAREANESEQAQKNVSGAKHRGNPSTKSASRSSRAESPVKRAREADLVGNGPQPKVGKNCTMKEVYKFVENVITVVSTNGDFLKYNKPRKEEAQAAEALTALQDAKLMKICDAYTREEAVAAC